MFIALPCSVLPVKMRVHSCSRPARRIVVAVLSAAAWMVVPSAKAQSEGTYRVTAVEVEPRLRNSAEVTRLIVASYPPALAAAGVTGTVKLRFRVQPNGRPDSVHVSETSHPEFGPPAIEVANRMRFAPAQINDRSVAVWIEIPIYFRPPASTAAPRDSAPR